MQREVGPFHMTYWLLQQIDLKKIVVSHRLLKVLRPYKLIFDNILRQDPIFKA